MNSGKLRFAFAIVALFVCLAQAHISVRVYSKEESLHEPNISKPRIYIENNGTEPISDFYYYYYFKIDEGYTPVFDDYYTPDCALSIHSAGDNIHFIRYHFAGVTLEPGEVKPNTGGNSIGLRYHDWSTWDKTNDPSNNLSPHFALNGEIPVFLADGTQIYGNGIPDPENPPQPPRVDLGLGTYAVFSSQYTDLRDGSTVRGGNVGSGQYAEAGCDSEIFGSLFSGGNIFLRERARIEGDVAATQEINKQNNIVITGEQRNIAQINFPQLAFSSVDYGTEDITVAPNDTVHLEPGAYNDIKVFANAKISLAPGTYTAKSFVVEPDVSIKLQSGEGKRTDIRVSDQLSIGDRVQMSFEEEELPFSVSFYSAQSGQLRIGTDALVYGLFTAPSADLHVSSRTTLYGAVAAKRAVIKPQAVVCKPPVLKDIWHSKWAYAPPFNPMVFEYDAVVPITTTEILTAPIAPQGVTVTVNGENPATPVLLNSDETDIFVHLSDSINCGETEYTLTVKREHRHQLFVDINTPAPENEQDGESWETAFRDLQPAIDKAMEEGREIWVAEGIYRPTLKMDDDDLRSATFLIRPGVEIKGGYDGTELTDTPQGSPYNTILSGDLAGNDDSISVWPPAPADSSYLSDNAYHVVTIDGNDGSRGVRLERLVITGGVANGGPKNSTGAGILNKKCSPTLIFVGVKRNIADSSGAGIMDKGGIIKIENCLFEDNVSTTGYGAGLFTSETNIIMDASVFDGNRVLDTIETSGGGALFSQSSDIEMVNCVFTRNSCGARGGAIVNRKSHLSITNCTFADNNANIYAQSIWNDSATAEVVNTILWNNRNRVEVGGDGFDISYSCITGWYEGEGNIFEDPQFVDMEDPKGSDGYGSFKDGLQLSDNSPCRNAGNNHFAPEADLLDMTRPIEHTVDIGAYEYFIQKDVDSIFGYLNRDGDFIPSAPITLLDTIHHWSRVHIYAAGNHAYVMRDYIPNNRHTRRKNKINAYFYSLNDDKTIRDDLEPIKIPIYHVGEDAGVLIYQTLTSDGQGKPILFVNDTTFHNWENRWAHIISTTNGLLKVEVPHSQFR
ncbi:choice-of-anchor Q domain-containing protein [Chitinispirillales bacterium ANBcel5]|uniref:choice-of-anchor Q domain-containing protein n=1 Tax=Cellulosispirillum alkaliphilum TaxID=3039283 RepID=UPI002A50775C|nr:choice-of-anchor Q domain-containing protein [Chitinispirillales bacterium ANBcel5]